MDQRILKWMITRNNDGSFHIEEHRQYFMMPLNRAPVSKEKLKSLTFNVEQVKDIQYITTFDPNETTFVFITKVDNKNGRTTSLDPSDEKNVLKIAKKYLTEQ